MVINVYFVRHAQPDFSIKEDSIRSLTEKGIKDSKKVTNALAGKGIAAIYSSPYLRAIDTVKDLADNLKLEIKTDDRFCERRVGAWVDDFHSYSKRQWSDFDFKLPGGESLRETQQRNISGLFDVINKNNAEGIVIGTHGTALSTIINYFRPEFGHADFMSIIDRMPYILNFKFSDGKLQVIEEIEMI